MNNFGNYYPVRHDDRIFLAPFLLGGLGGAALVGLSRPRPVYVNPPYYPPRPYPQYPPYRPYGGYGYSNSNYNYYY